MRRTVNTVLLVFLVLNMVVSGKADTQWKPARGPLATRWTKDVSPENAHPEYPRPQMVRQGWLNLNGLWELAVTGKEQPEPKEFTEQILVPFPIESALSGVMKRVNEKNRLWYRRTFELPKDWKGKRVLLHFQSVDWESVVYVNGKELGDHRGGYDAFSYDITDALKSSGKQELVLSVWDPSDAGGQPHGKQVKNPGGIMYTPTTGIWQTVWLEPVPQAYIEKIIMTPDVDNQRLWVTVLGKNTTKEHLVTAHVRDNGGIVETASLSLGRKDDIKISTPKLWSCDNPHLYDIEIILSRQRLLGKPEVVDKVKSYFGMRQIELGKDENGITRLMLNGKFVFQIGLLDQGFWPDGLYAAPTDEALRYDVEITKKLGFNMARKHVKIEPDRWYYWCDKLRLLVWQDMPAGSNATSADKKQFEVELRRMVEGFINHPSIIMWVPFNEGWGQYDTQRLVKLIKQWDPSRLVDNASGWSDRKVGDVHDIHSYPGPDAPQPEPTRAAVLGEFGGLGMQVKGHSWQKEFWGYQTLADSEKLTVRYEELLHGIARLKTDSGLSAAVYTQTSDIETESNGLLTYDREVIKMDADRVRLANLGFVPPVFINDVNIFIDKIDVKLAGGSDDDNIRYTLDGSEPTATSPRYVGPIRLNQTTTVKARTFWPDGKKSAVAGAAFTRVSPRKAVDVAQLSPGLKYDYYEAGRFEKLPDFAALKPTASGTCEKISLNLAKRKENYALKFEGFIDAPADGVYTFYLTSDDGSELYIGDKLLIDNRGVHGMREVKGTITLKAGKHPLTPTFFQGFGGQGLRLTLKAPTIAPNKRPIPSNILWHAK